MYTLLFSCRISEIVLCGRSEGRREEAWFAGEGPRRLLLTRQVQSKLVIVYLSVAILVTPEVVATHSIIHKLLSSTRLSNSGIALRSLGRFTDIFMSFFSSGSVSSTCMSLHTLRTSSSLILPLLHTTHTDGMCIKRAFKERG